MDWRARLDRPRAIWTAARASGLRRSFSRLWRRLSERSAYRRWLAGPRPGPGPRLEAVDGPGPLVSILMPVYQPDPRWLRRAVDSVRGQGYGRWELCIADDTAAGSGGDTLASLGGMDCRIRLDRRSARGHISAASNTALARAQGDFVALLDQDDELAPHALEQVVKALARQPDAELLYSDEDKIDEHGRRLDPYFKPDWSPDLSLSQNLVSHLGVYRTSTVREVGGFREGFEGSQDHDLALRVVERCGDARVRHIPEVLYHWRVTPGSTAGGHQRKGYAIETGARAVQSHLDRLGRRATVEPALRSYYRVRWALPESPTSVAVVTPRASGAAAPWLGAPRTLLDVSVEAIPGMAGRAARLNAAARGSRAEVVVFLGDGCTLEPPALEELVAQALRPEVGVAGGQVVSPRRRVLHGGYLVALDAGGAVLNAHRGLHEDEPGHFGRNALVQNFLAASADAMAVRREAFDDLGGFDPDVFPERLFDVDFGLRAWKAGLRVVWSPSARVLRDDSVSSRSAGPVSGGEAGRLVERWASSVPRDPFWHPALDRRYGDFRLQG